MINIFHKARNGSISYHVFHLSIPNLSTGFSLNRRATLIPIAWPIWRWYCKMYSGFSEVLSQLWGTVALISPTGIRARDSRPPRRYPLDIRQPFELNPNSIIRYCINFAVGIHNLFVTGQPGWPWYYASSLDSKNSTERRVIRDLANTIQANSSCDCSRSFIRSYKNISGGLPQEWRSFNSSPGPISDRLVASDFRTNNVGRRTKLLPGLIRKIISH